MGNIVLFIVMVILTVGLFMFPSASPIIGSLLLLAVMLTFFFGFIAIIRVVVSPGNTINRN